MQQNLIPQAQSVIFQQPLQYSQIIHSRIDKYQDLIEDHLIKRPIQITNIEDIEDSWRKRAMKLEREYVASMLELQESKLIAKVDRRSTFFKAKNVQFKDIRVDREVNNLQEQLRDKNDQLEGLASTFNLYKDQLQQQQEKVANMEEDLQEKTNQFIEVSTVLLQIQQKLQLKKKELLSLQQQQQEQEQEQEQQLENVEYKQIHLMSLNE